MSAEIEKYDALTHWRCPPLGGPVTFKHCRKTNGGLPCRQMPICWAEKIDVPEFFMNNYSMEQLETAFGTDPKGRLDTIIETLDKQQP